MSTYFGIIDNSSLGGDSIWKQYQPKKATVPFEAQHFECQLLNLVLCNINFSTTSTLITQLSNSGTTKQVLTLISPYFVYGHNMKLRSYGNHVRQVKFCATSLIWVNVDIFSKCFLLVTLNMWADSVPTYIGFIGDVCILSD